MTRVPVDEDGWAILCARLVERRIGEANISQVELTRRLRRFGATQSYTTTSAKIARGRFAAGFLLQSFVAAGASTIALPVRSGEDSLHGSASSDQQQVVAGRINRDFPPSVHRARAEGASFPTDDAGWQALAANILDQTISRAGATRIDLFWRLRRLGVHHSVKEIARRLDRGTFQAVLLLQLLVALGVDEVDLPVREMGSDDVQA